MRQCEDDPFFLPLGDTARLAVRQNGDCFLEIDNHLFFSGRVGHERRHTEAQRDASDHALFSSRPDIVPVEDAKRFVSIPMRWSIETNRLGRG